jgi:hypothetical protein
MTPRSPAQLLFVRFLQGIYRAFAPSCERAMILLANPPPFFSRSALVDAMDVLSGLFMTTHNQLQPRHI